MQQSLNSFLDRDGNGEISFQEFTDVMMDLGDGLTMDECNRMRKWLENMHNIEMERVRKSHSQQMDRFRLQHTSVGQGVNTSVALNSSIVVGTIGTGIAGPRKAFEASNLPLDQYLQYLEKFQQDSTVLTTLEKSNRQ